jgi:hypothetical protein
MKNSKLPLIAVLLIGITPVAVAGNLSVPGDYATIQEAVYAAAPGDVINVGSGNFAGAVIFNKAVTIIGSPGTIVNEGNPWYSRDAFSIIYSGADGTTISNMTFVGVNGVLWGVRGYHVDEVTVTNCVFLDTFQAVETYFGDRWRIADVSIQDSPFGVSGFRAQDVTVTNSLFLDTHIAVANSGGNGWTITDNVVDGFIPFPPPGPGAENHQEAILIMAPARDNYIGDNWIRHESNRNPGYTVEYNNGIALASSGGVLESNIVVGNEVEVVVPDSDASVGVGLYAFGDPAAIRNNMVVDNDLRRSLTPINLFPKKLRSSNVVAPNLVR